LIISVSKYKLLAGRGLVPIFVVGYFGNTLKV